MNDAFKPINGPEDSFFNPDRIEYGTQNGSNETLSAYPPATATTETSTSSFMSEFTETERAEIYELCTHRIVTISENPGNYHIALQHAYIQHGPDAFEMIKCLASDIQNRLNPHMPKKDGENLHYWLARPRRQWEISAQAFRFCIMGDSRVHEMGVIEQSLFPFKTTDYDKQFFEPPQIDPATVIQTPSDLILAMTLLQTNLQTIYEPKTEADATLLSIAFSICHKFGNTLNQVLYAYDDILSKVPQVGLDLSPSQIEILYSYLLSEHGLDGIEEQNLSTIKVKWKPMAILTLQRNAKPNKGKKSGNPPIFKGARLITAYKHVASSDPDYCLR